MQIINLLLKSDSNFLSFIFLATHALQLVHTDACMIYTGYVCVCVLCIYTLSQYMYDIRNG